MKKRSGIRGFNQRGGVEGVVAGCAEAVIRRNLLAGQGLGLVGKIFNTGIKVQIPGTGIKNRSARQVYRRVQEKGRMLPDGLNYLNSWVATDFDRCFQLMETENPALFRKWVDRWEDLVEFEVIPVVSSEEANKAILNAV